MITTAAIFVWELSLGVCLVIRDFKPSPITAGMTAQDSSRSGWTQI
jgi:hypothetical protein